MIDTSTKEPFESTYIETTLGARKPELISSVLEGRMKSLLRRRRRLLKKSRLVNDGR